MHVSKLFLVLIMLLVLSSQFSVAASFADAREDMAASALENAEESIVLAYQATLRAEEAGANVSGLLVRLNEAGGFLANAGMAYRLGDLEESARLANSSRNIGVEVESEAIELRASALSVRLQRMTFTMIASVLGVAFVALGSFWAWRLFKKRYYNRILKMRPEVGFDDS